MIDGIIFIYNANNNDVLNNIINYIHKIDKKLKKEKILPKIILGNKKDILNCLGEKEKKTFNNFKKSIFIENSANQKNGITLALEEFVKIKKLYDKYENFVNKNKINDKQTINYFSKSKLNIVKCLKCNQIFKISINDYSNYVYLYCPKCNLEKKIGFNRL